MVFLIPGYGLEKATLLPLGVAFTRMGFVSVLVDLPGQGESGGSHIGYGFLEARYVNDLIAHFHHLHHLQGKIVLMGISYGAAVAIDAAGLNPNVSRVIAIAPFARITPAIERYARARYSRAFSRLTELQFKRALSKAEQILGYSFEDHSPLNFAPKIAARVLYIAGSKDDIAPLSDIKSLARKTPHATLVVAKGYNHYRLVMEADHFMGAVTGWLSDHGQKPSVDSRLSYEVGIICHLVPTHKCWMMASVSGDTGKVDHAIGALSITLKSTNIYVPNGVFNGTIKIDDNNIDLAKRSIKISVSDGHVRLSRIDIVKRWLGEHKGSGYNVVRWESDEILKPTALPLM
ncbi:MAG: alpha/beta hydrolase, partial [Ktedonobacteraceae bacterium]